MQRAKTKIHALTHSQMAQKKDLDDQRDTDVNDWNRGNHQTRVHLSIIISLR